MSKAIITSISLPGSLAREVEKEARAEHQTKSGLIQEAIRAYLEQRRWRRLQQNVAARAQRLGIASEDDIEQIIDAMRAQ